MTCPGSCRAPQHFSNSSLDLQAQWLQPVLHTFRVIFLIHKAGLPPTTLPALLTKTLSGSHLPTGSRPSSITWHQVLPAQSLPTSPAPSPAPVTASLPCARPQWGPGDTMINRTWHKDEQDLAYTLKKPEVLWGRQTQRWIVAMQMDSRGEA